MASQEAAPFLNRRRGTTKSTLQAFIIDTVSSKKYVMAFFVVIGGLFILIYSSSSNDNKSAEIAAKINPAANTQQKIPMDEDESLSKKMAEFEIMQEHLSMANNSAPQESETNSTDTMYPFVKEHCDLTGVEWYPTGSKVWQQRAPYFLLIGAKKAGTTTLWYWLKQHPLISNARTKELLYFLPTQYQHYDKSGKVNVHDTRIDMYNLVGGDYNAKDVSANRHHVAFEATPGYLFHTYSCIPAILCSCPWVKLLAILREPTDRVLSHYNFAMDPSKGRSTTNSLEDWIEHDFGRLRNAGVIQTTIPQELFHGSNEEKMAWNKYLSALLRNEAGPIGRSLYAIQLELWFEALISIGRDPKTEFMVVRNDDMRTDADKTCNKIFDWLDLPANHLDNYVEKLKTAYTLTTMSNETSTMLKEFFKPYNQRLYKLLGEDWTDDWDNTEPHHVPEDQIYSKDNVSGVDVVLPPTPNYTRAETLHMLPNYQHQDYNKTQGQLFTDKWCDLTGVDWYPTAEQDQWQFRAPYFMLPGAKKSGTTSLADYISQHSLVEPARTKELQLFLNKNFRREYVDENRRTLVKQAREKMYKEDYHSDALMRNNSIISFDATPGYLFFSAMLPQRILCVAPWIKLVLILRNPVDRAYSNHAFVQLTTGMTTGFEDWIAQDLNFLNQSGFLDATTEEEEDATWPEYLKYTLEGPIGRGLYDIQIRQWQAAMEEAGRDPSTQIYIVRSEELHVNKVAEYQKILKFLGLPDRLLKDESEKVVSDYQEPMKNETRTMLEKLFQPYNKKLYARLGGDWNGVWDPKV